MHRLTTTLYARRANYKHSLQKKMIQEHNNNHIPSRIIEFNPIIVVEETNFIDIIKKFIEIGNYGVGDGVLVKNQSSTTKIITIEKIVRIIASGLSVFSLKAKNIGVDFPCKKISEIKDIFTLANLFYENNYPGYGVLNEEGIFEGLITPRTLIEYFLTENIYETITIQDLQLDNLIEVPSYLSIIAVSKIMSQQNFTAIKYHKSGETKPRIISFIDIMYLLVNPPWNNKILQNIDSSVLPDYSLSDNIATVTKSLQSNYGGLVNYKISSNQVNYDEQKKLYLNNNKHDNLIFSNHNKSQLTPIKNINIKNLDNCNTSLITPQSLLQLFTHSWKHNYLIQQEQKLHQLQTTIKVKKKEVEQEKIFSKLSDHIRQSIHLDDILSNTVQEVRNFLQCDRVIIYQQCPGGNGLIISESVIDGIPSLLGREIEDHCFSQDYIKPYLEGRIQATENIFTANLSPCHLDLLLSLQVKANLVVPIIFHDQLWGLLAAQNCKTFRKWEKEELTLLQKLASQVAIAIQQSEYAETAVKIANYQTAIASLGNSALITNNIEQLMHTAVKIVSKTLNIEFCHIVELLKNKAAFVLKACVGWSSEWIEIAKISANPRWMQGYTLNILQPVISEDLRIETRFNPSPFLHNQGIVSGACVVIGNNTNYYAVLGIYSKTPRKFAREEINFLQTVANVLATAIERIKSQEQLDCFFNLSLDLFCLAGLDGSLKKVNSSFFATLGYTEEELLNHNVMDFIHLEDKEITLKEFENLSQGLPSINFENRWRCKNGTYRWLAWKSLPYEEGIVYAVARDTTGAKQAQEELKMLNEKLELRVKDRTKELEETSNQLHTFVQTAGTILIVLNREYRILEWNEEAEKVFGWKRDSVLGEDYFLLFAPPSERKKLYKFFEETIKTGKTQRNVESKILNSEGNERVLLWNINRFLNNKGEGIGIIACLQDVEEVRLAQLKLKLSEERFRSIFNQAAVGILQVSLPGKLVLVNDKFTELLGYPQEKLSQLDFQELIDGEDMSNTLSDLSELLAGNQITFEREIRMVHFSGEILWVNLTMSVVWVSVEPSYFIAVVNDISDRKRIEDSLQKSQARLNSILNSVQDVVWSYSLPEMKLRYINPACKIIYGKSPEELKSDPTLLQKIATDEDRKKVAKFWQNIINDSHITKSESELEKNWEIEYQIKLPNQKTRWIRERSHLVYDRYGRAISIDGITTDVTKQHEAENKLFKSLEEKEVLLKEIHHRVKNNLYVISGLLNLQSSYIEDEKVRNLFEDSQYRIQTMAVVHEQLYQSDDLSDIDFAKYIERLINNLFLSYNSQQSGIKSITNLEHCYLNIETAIPAGLLINEIITNAFKHAFPNGKGGIKIELKVSKNQKINLTISDNGKGLPSNLNWEESPSLGLRLVRLLSQQIEAEIKVKTSKKGTSFSLEFIANNS